MYFAIPRCKHQVESQKMEHTSLIPYICKDVSTVYMVKGRHPQLDTKFHDWSEFIPYSFAANFDPNVTTEVPTEGGLMASEIFAPEMLYSSVIHNFEYHLAIHFRTLAGILSSSSG